MSSAINPALPGSGRAFTLDVRQNFAGARSEIELLQNRVNAIADELAGMGSGYLPLTGGTMRGQLLLYADPQEPAGAATKRYVDAEIDAIPTDFLPLAGGSLTGALLLADDPTQPTGAATKRYVDSVVGGITYPFLPITGGTLTGPLTLAADPTVALHAATKQYADTKLALAGGTMTGALTIGPISSSSLVAPLRAMHATLGAGAGDYRPLAWFYLQTNNGQSLNIEARRHTAGDSWTTATMRIGMSVDATVMSYIDFNPMESVRGLKIEAASGSRLLLNAGGAEIKAGGPLLLAADPTVPEGAATKGYVDRTFLTDAPATGGAFGRWQNSWIAVLPLIGGTVSGATRFSAPGNALVVDNQIIANSMALTVSAKLGAIGFLDAADDTHKEFQFRTGGITRWLLRLAHAAGNLDFFLHRMNAAGGWLDSPLSVSAATGMVTITALTLVADPTAAMHAATKQYVDALAARVAALEGHA